MAETRLARRNYGRGHGYKLDGEKVVGVTTVIGALDKPALRNWYAEQAAKRVVDDWDHIQALKPSERMAYVKDGPKDIVRAAALRGTQIHSLGEQLAAGESPDVPDEHKGPVEGYARFLDKYDVETIATETPLCHTQHLYAGTADMWGRLTVDGERVLALLDVKTGKGVWSETGLQLAAYRHSNLMQPAKDSEIPTPAVERVFVAHVMPDTTRLLPVEAGEQEFRTFLYLLQVHRAVEGWKDFPLIGEAVS